MTEKNFGFLFELIIPSERFLFRIYGFHDNRLGAIIFLVFVTRHKNFGNSKNEFLIIKSNEFI